MTYDRLVAIGIDEDNALRIACDLELYNECRGGAELVMDQEYLTLIIEGSIITQGETEVRDRLAQINRESGFHDWR